MTQSTGTILKSSLYGGLLAGSVDVCAASLLNMANPLVILLAIATGVLGRAAFKGGAGAMVLGLVLQWAMSSIIAAIFTFAASKLPSLARRWILWGAVYGVIIFVVMNFVVVPWSASPIKPHFTVAWFSENLLAMLVFGWIVALTARRVLTPAR